jgi:hypothetical protein
LPSLVGSPACSVWSWHCFRPSSSVAGQVANERILGAV